MKPQASNPFPAQLPALDGHFAVFLHILAPFQVAISCTGWQRWI